MQTMNWCTFYGGSSVNRKKIKPKHLPRIRWTRVSRCRWEELSRKQRKSETTLKAYIDTSSAKSKQKIYLVYLKGGFPLFRPIVRRACLFGTKLVSVPSFSESLKAPLTYSIKPSSFFQVMTISCHWLVTSSVESCHSLVDVVTCEGMVMNVIFIIICSSISINITIIIASSILFSFLPFSSRLCHHLSSASSPSQSYRWTRRRKHPNAGHTHILTSISVSRLLCDSHNVYFFPWSDLLVKWWPFLLHLECPWIRVY